MQTSASDCPVNILLIDDNPADVRMILYALREEKTWLTDVVVVDDGEKAIRYLIEQSSSTRGAIPDLVILDLNLPKWDGTEVLRTIRTTAGLENLAVVIFTSSPVEVSESIVRQANLQANGYLAKPTNADEFLSMGRAFRVLSEAAMAGGSQPMTVDCLAETAGAC
jgi:two-component system, chemotaxis family, response regulator Rcp1